MRPSNPGIGKRKKAALLCWLEPLTSMPSPKAPLSAGDLVHSHLPPPWELPRAPPRPLEGQILETPQAFFLSVSPETLASPWPLPYLDFHQQKGAVEYVRDTEQDFCTEQGPHINGLPPQGLQLHKLIREHSAQPRPHASVSVPAPQKQSAAMNGQGDGRGISRPRLPLTDAGLHLAAAPRLSQAAGAWPAMSWDCYPLYRGDRRH